MRGSGQGSSLSAFEMTPTDGREATKMEMVWKEICYRKSSVLSSHGYHTIPDTFSDCPVARHVWWFPCSDWSVTMHLNVDMEK